MELHFLSKRPLLKWSERPKQPMFIFRVAIYTNRPVRSASHPYFFGFLFCHPFSAFFDHRTEKGIKGKEGVGVKGKERVRDGWRGMVWGKWAGFGGIDTIMTIRNKRLKFTGFSIIGGVGETDGDSVICEEQPSYYI